MTPPFQLHLTFVRLKMWQCLSVRDPFDEVWSVPERTTKPVDPELLIREKIPSGERPNTNSQKRNTRVSED